MAIFGNQNLSSVSAPVVIEGYTSAVDGDVIAYQEFFEDMASVYESVHEADMLEIQVRKNNGGVSLESVMESASEEYNQFEVAMEAAVSNVWEKLKAAVKKLWAKIKGFFKSVRKYFDYLIMDSTKFAKTYEKELRRKSGLIGGMEVTIHSYNDAVIDNKDFKIYSNLDSVTNTSVRDEADAERIIEKYYKDSETVEKQVLSVYRTSLVGGTGKKDDWTEDLYAHFRGGEKSAEDKKEVKGPDIMAMCKVLQETKIVSKLVGIEKEMDKSFGNSIKEIDNASKDKGQSLIRLFSKKQAALTSCHAIGTSFIKGWEKAAKERNRAYKSVCMKALTYKQKDN